MAGYFNLIITAQSDSDYKYELLNQSGTVNVESLSLPFTKEELANGDCSLTFQFDHHDYEDPSDYLDLQFYYEDGHSDYTTPSFDSNNSVTAVIPKDVKNIGVYLWYNESMYYDGIWFENIVPKSSSTPSTEHNVGDIVTLDGIECLIIYKADTEQSWGQYLCVDKNHDLVWYFAGEDYCDQFLTIDSAKYGYEWGGHGTATNITDQSIGAGLTNTNSLISLSLSPKNASWNVIWDMIEQFRTSVDSDKWFLTISLLSSLQTSS